MNISSQSTDLAVPIQNSFHTSAVESREVLKSLPSVVGTVATTRSHETSLTSRSIANMQDKDSHTRQTEIKQLAVDKCLSSEVGKQILSQFNLDNVEEARAIISAVVGTRSSTKATTAISRANSILRFLRWSSGKPRLQVGPM